MWVIQGVILRLKVQWVDLMVVGEARVMVVIMVEIRGVTQVLLHVQSGIGSSTSTAAMGGVLFEARRVAVMTQ